MREADYLGVSSGNKVDEIQKKRKKTRTQATTLDEHRQPVDEVCLPPQLMVGSARIKQLHHCET